MKNLTKNLKSNPYGKYNGNESEYVLRALDSEDIENQRTPWVERFEKKFSERLGVKYAIAHNSGTSALHTCLMAAGVGHGDEVVTPAITVIMDAFACLYVGATPVFADIDPHTFTIDPSDIARKITKKTKAIITVSINGLPVDMDPILDIAAKHDLIVIDDNAQTVLGYDKGQISGTFAHMGCFSFETKKHLSTGEGGMVITNDPELAVKVRKAAGIGYKNLAAESKGMALLPENFQSPNYKRHDSLGYNYRMPELCAAVGLAQLERIDELVARRQFIGESFNQAIAGCDWLIPQKVPEGFVSSYYTYALIYKGEERFGITWHDFRKRYIAMGGDGFYGAHSVPYEEPALVKLNLAGKGTCPVAEALQPKMMLFKTNYRNMDVAQRKASILTELIEAIERK